MKEDNKMKRIHYAWVICGVCTLTMICSMGFCCTCQGVYLPYIMETGLSGSEGSLILSLRSFSSLAAIFFISRYYEKVSLRTGIAVALILCSAGMILFSLGGSVWVYYAAALVLGFGYSLSASIPVSLLISEWFAGHRGKALGICSAGSGVAAICIPPCVEYLVRNFSLRVMFLTLAGVILLADLLIWSLIRNTPEEMGLTAYGGKEEKMDKAFSGGVYLPIAGWGCLIVLMVLQGSFTPAGNHLSVLMTTSGYTTELAATVLSLYGVSIMVGKLVFGAAVDRIGAERATVVAYVLAIASCLLPLKMDGVLLWPCLVTVLLSGVASPPNSVGIALVAADISAKESFGSTMKWMEIVSILGSIVFGIMPGAYYDIYGSYQGAYVILAVCTAVCIPLLWLLYRCRKPVGAPVE